MFSQDTSLLCARHGSTPLVNQSPDPDDMYDEIPKCMCGNFSTILPPTKCSRTDLQDVVLFNPGVAGKPTSRMRHKSLNGADNEGCRL
jgi:hypothetical protein